MDTGSPPRTLLALCLQGESPIGERGSPGGRGDSPLGERGAPGGQGEWPSSQRSPLAETLNFVDSDLDHFKIFFASPAFRAYPVLRNILPARPCFNTLFRQPGFLVVNETADDAHISLEFSHTKTPVVQAGIVTPTRGNATIVVESIRLSMNEVRIRVKPLHP